MASRVAGAFLLLLVVSFAGSALANETADPVALVVETRNGPVSFTVEIADTDAERAVGLMNRESMPDDHGMLFDFGATRDIYMWMKNTILPLDMIFITQDGVIAGIAADTVPFSEAVIASPGPVAYVLEINAGTSERRGIAAGDKVTHPAIAR